MIAYLLRETGLGCNAFLGGVSGNYGVNYWSSANEVAVVEADEYDRSFLKLHPDIALLTAMDADHLDIYGTVEDMEEAFIQYTKNIKHNGTLLVKHGLKRENDLHASHKITYSLQNDAADAYAANITQKQGGYVFDVVNKYGLVQDVRLNIGGMHNVENAVAAITVAQMLEIDRLQIKEAMAGFKGVKRRFEYVIKNNKIIYIDDYAHHPEELATLIKSAKRLFPDRRCVMIFQPHLFSRTRDLAEGFASSLDIADEVILLDIYPARELPIDGVTTQLIADKMSNPAHTVLSKEGLLDYVKAAPLNLLITAGAGDIDQLVKPIREILEHK
jgi:UDP-N-acetylmuramate--alanine ligase